MVRSGRIAVGSTFAAFEGRDYQLYFVGQLISTAGTWMQNVALLYLVYAMTRDALVLGLVACASGLPMLFLAPVAGIIVERSPRRRLLMVLQVIEMLLALFLALLVATGVAQVWHLVLLSLLFGMTNAFDFPCRQALIIEMVSPSHLSSGITLNNLLTNCARWVGPVLAGVMLATLGAAACFFLNGLSFLAVLLSLAVIRVPYATAHRRNEAPFRQMVEGFRYAQSNSQVLPLLLLTGCTTGFMVSISQFFSPFAVQVLNSPIQGYSLLCAGNGLGAVLAGITVEPCARRWGRGRVIGAALLLAALSNILLALQTQVLSAAVLSVLNGLFTVAGIISLNTTIQTSIADAYRGRIMALYALAIFTPTPLGTLAMGGLAGFLGAARAMLLFATLGGAICTLILAHYPHVLSGHISMAFSLVSEESPIDEAKTQA